MGGQDQAAGGPTWQHGQHGQAGLAWLMAGGLAILAVTWATSHFANVESYDRFVIGALVHGALFALAVWLVVIKRLRGGFVLGLIIAVAIGLRVIGFATPHDGLTTDAYRYVWDGRIQWAGFNPYAQPPADLALSDLRDAETFPNINQKEQSVTVYPPFAQMLFAGANSIADRVLGPKVIMTLADLAIVGLSILLIGAAGLPRERVIIYAWHPLPVWEFVSQAHIDAAATALMVLGLLLIWQRRQGIAGAVFALAVMTKYFPLTLVPAIWRRWDLRAPCAFAAICAALALPYWLWGQSNLFGYLGTHLDNEGYAAGWGFHPVWMLRDFQLGDMSGRLYTTLALIALGALAAWTFVVRGRDTLQPAHLVALAATFVWLTSPHYPWYFGWIIPLLCLHLSPAALVMTLASVALYWPRPPDGATWTELYALVYYAPVAIALAHWVWQGRSAANAVSR